MRQLKRPGRWRARNVTLACLLVVVILMTGGVGAYLLSVNADLNRLGRDPIAQTPPGASLVLEQRLHPQYVFVSRPWRLTRTFLVTGKSAEAEAAEYVRRFGADYGLADADGIPNEGLTTSGQNDRVWVSLSFADAAIGGERPPNLQIPPGCSIVVVTISRPPW